MSSTLWIKSFGRVSCLTFDWESSFVLTKNDGAKGKILLAISAAELKVESRMRPSKDLFVAKSTQTLELLEVGDDTKEKYKEQSEKTTTAFDEVNI